MVNNDRFCKLYPVSNLSRQRFIVHRVSHPQVNFSKLFVLGYAFRSDGRYFVIAERHKSKDTLGVYEATEGYKLVRVCCRHRDCYWLFTTTFYKHFLLPTTTFASFSLSPTGNNVAVWEGPLEVRHSPA